MLNLLPVLWNTYQTPSWVLGTSSPCLLETSSWWEMHIQQAQNDCGGQLRGLESGESSELSWSSGWAEGGMSGARLGYGGG